MKKLLASLYSVLLALGICIAFVGCGNGTDAKKEVIKYGKEYNYTYDIIDDNVLIMGTGSEPQRTTTIITTFSNSYIFYTDGTYKLIENTVEREQSKETESSQTTTNGYGTFVILSDNYFYLTQYSYNGDLLSVLITQRFKIEDENTLVTDTMPQHTYSIK